MATPLTETEVELEKAYGTGEETEEEAIQELNKAGVRHLRDLAKGGKKDAKKEDKEDDDEDEDEEDEDEEDDDDEEKSMSGAVAEAEEIFGSLVKNADGELVELINGNEVLADVLKSFSGVIAEGNVNGERLSAMVKAVHIQQTVQSSALLEMNDTLCKGIELLSDAVQSLPIGQPQRGALMEFSNNLRLVQKKRSTETLSKSVDQDDSAGEEPAGDRWGGKTPTDIFRMVKKSFEDPELREKYDLKPEHLMVQRRGVSILPKKFRADFDLPVD